jgi:hypothetical protein
MMNPTYRIPPLGITYKDEVIKFAIWGLGIRFRRREENLRLCRRIVFRVLSGEIDQALQMVKELPGGRIRGKMEAHIHFLLNMTPECISIPSNILKFSHWFMSIPLQEEQNEVRERIITLILNNQLEWADFEVSALDCPVVRESVRDYLAILPLL